MTTLKQPTREAQGEAAEIHLVTVGDIMLADAAQPFLDTYGYDYPFRNLRSSFTGADLLVGNLEVPLTRHPTPLDPDKTYIYKADPASASALKDFGFNLLCLANNHMLDYGVQGLLDTLETLRTCELPHFGAGASYADAVAGAVLEAKGTRVGHLGFMERYGPYGTTYPDYFARGDQPGVAEMSEEAVRQATGALKPAVDVLVVHLHWGRNYAPVTEVQRTWGRLAVDLGADLVLGHHPHVAQGVEVYGGVPIVYSLGNFTFGTPGRFANVDERLHYGWVADAVIRGRELTRLELLPVEVNNQVVKFQPRVADAAVLTRLLPFLNGAFGTEMDIVGDRARLSLETP